MSYCKDGSNHFYGSNNFYPTEPDTKEEPVKESMEKILKMEVVVNRKDKDLIDIIQEVINDPDVSTVTIKMDRNVVRIKTKMKWQD